LKKKNVRRKWFYQLAVDWMEAVLNASFSSIVKRGCFSRVNYLKSLEFFTKEKSVVVFFFCQDMPF